MLWRFVHPLLRLSHSGGFSSHPLISTSPSPHQISVELSKYASWTPWRVRISEGVGTAIKKGPIAKGRRAGPGARGPGAHPAPGSGVCEPHREAGGPKHHLCGWFPSSLILGKSACTPGAGNRSRTRPMWSAARVVALRSPPHPTPARPCGRIMRGTGLAWGLSSRRTAGAPFPCAPLCEGCVPQTTLGLSPALMFMSTCVVW